MTDDLYRAGTTFATPKVALPGVDQDAAGALDWRLTQDKLWTWRLGRLGAKHSVPHPSRLAERRAAAKRARVARRVNR